MKRKHLSARFEPAYSEGGFKADPAEKKTARPDAKQDEIASKMRKETKN